MLPEPNLAQLERSVRYGWMAFQVSHYQTIGLLLPDLIREAQAAVWQLDGDDERAAQGWLAWTYQLTAATAFKLGDAQLGWVAADRGIQLAEQTEDLTLVGNAARWVTHALMYTHEGSDAVTLVRSAADRLAPHLAHAALADMQSGGRVIEAAEQIAGADLLRLPKERRASHLLDVARGHVQWGKRDEASTMLLDADQYAPEEVRCRPMTRQLITDLVRSYPRGSRAPAALTTVARAVGVTA